MRCSHSPTALPPYRLTDLRTARQTQRRGKHARAEHGARSRIPEVQVRHFRMGHGVGHAHGSVNQILGAQEVSGSEKTEIGRPAEMEHAGPLLDELEIQAALA